MSRRTILLAGGGTGGHVFPMIAVADALRAEADVDVVFVGTARGIEARVVPERGDDLRLLDIVPIKGGGVSGAIRGVVKAALALPRARALVKQIAPSAVLSVGGYAAGPVALAARSVGVPVAILEPNSVLGLANRWLSPFARRAYVAFPEVEKQLRAGAVVRSGVPLRKAFAPSAYAPAGGRLRVLVLGGSQGAVALNASVPQALALAAPLVPELTVLHQAGKDREADVRARYADLWVSGQARVVPFLDDVATALAEADLVIGRAGASSLAELCAVGRASILVPFPFAADEHQRRNAESLAAAGAAVCLVQADATPEVLAAKILELARDPSLRVAMAQAARDRGRPDAARAVARDLLGMAGVAPSAGGRSPERGSEVPAPPRSGPSTPRPVRITSMSPGEARRV